MSIVVSFFVFFKRKTAYVLLISDCSSDVCSADPQRAAQHAEEAERQRDQAGDQPLLSLLLALCRDGRIAHASASSAAAICLKSSSRSSGSALSCRPGMPWFSHQSPAST